MKTTTLTNRHTGRSTTMRLDLRGASDLWSAPYARVRAALNRIDCVGCQPVRSTESFIAFDTAGRPVQMFDAA